MTCLDKALNIDIFSTNNIGFRDAKLPAYAKHSLSRIFVNKKKKVEINIFLTTTFLQRLSYNVLLTTSFSQRLPTTSFSHRCPNIFVHMRSPHNVTIYMYVWSFCAVQMSQNIRKSLKFKPSNFDNFWSIKLKPRRCTSAIYILSLWEVWEL